MRFATLIAMASASGKRSVSASASTSVVNGKRPRFVPPPLESIVKAEPDEIHSIAGLSRYSLRQRGVATSGDADTSSSSSVKVEDEEDTKASLSPSKKNKAMKIDPFATSPRKTSSKPIKIDLDASEARAAPKRWKEQYEVLIKQRKRIIAPVDTMGCQENGKDEKRKDISSEIESEEDKARRERFTILVSLMLSSQTKDPVTAEAVHNLQQNLIGGLSLKSILAATQDEISSNINKVGFWRRKTGYIQSTARIIQDDFDGDVPKTIDDLCSLPGVGPKMAFLTMQSAWKINVGIGVDVHVHRVANRINFVKSKDPEGTRLQLQSWLPKELHPTINKLLVGFGQVICQPVGPRCDLCSLGAHRLCPSYRKVDPKSIASRVKIELLPEEEDSNSLSSATVKVEGPDGEGALQVKEEDVAGEAIAPVIASGIKQETDRLDW